MDTETSLRHCTDDTEVANRQNNIHATVTPKTVKFAFPVRLYHGVVMQSRVQTNHSERHQGFINLGLLYDGNVPVGVKRGSRGLCEEANWEFVYGNWCIAGSSADMFRM